MAVRYYRTQGWVADTKADLSSISGVNNGTSCLVIDESARYRINSEGKWVKATCGSGSTNPEFEARIADLEADIIAEASTRAQDKNELLAADAAINANPVMKMFNPSLDLTGQYGIYLPIEDGRSLIQAMSEAGLGIYNFWVQKGSSDLPTKMITENTSGRGICGVDYFNGSSDWCGWVIMFNKSNDVYFRFISHAIAGPWLKMAVDAE